MKSIIINIERCPRCEQPHDAMHFKPLRIVGEFSHHADCYNQLAPVLLRTTLCTLGVCGISGDGHAHPSGAGAWRVTLSDSFAQGFWNITGYNTDEVIGAAARKLLTEFMRRQ